MGLNGKTEGIPKDVESCSGIRTGWQHSYLSSYDVIITSCNADMDDVYTTSLEPRLVLLQSTVINTYELRNLSSAVNSHTHNTVQAFVLGRQISYHSVRVHIREQITKNGWILDIHKGLTTWRKGNTVSIFRC